MLLKFKKRRYYMGPKGPNYFYFYEHLKSFPLYFHPHLMSLHDFFSFIFVRGSLSRLARLRWTQVVEHELYRFIVWIGISSIVVVQKTRAPSQAFNSKQF